MKTQIQLLAIVLWLSCCGGFASGPTADPRQFLIDGCSFVARSDNPYLPIYPGRRLVLQDEENGQLTRLVWEVLPQTREISVEINGIPTLVTTAVVQETHTVNGNLEEISRNYFAQCLETGSVFYFGEDVDIVRDGHTVGHDGSWLAGVDGNQPGIVMPGEFAEGDAYSQEFAPGIAEDLALNTRAGLTVDLPAGYFSSVIEVEETDGLKPGSEPSLKRYAAGIGLVVDDTLELVEFSGAPFLRIDPAVRLTWPALSGSFVLESAASVFGPWTAVDADVREVKGLKEAWVTAGSARRFFRLRKG